jgi:hypothetical protein
MPFAVSRHSCQEVWLAEILQVPVAFGSRALCTCRDFRTRPCALSRCGNWRHRRFAACSRPAVRRGNCAQNTGDIFTMRAPGHHAVLILRMRERESPRVKLAKRQPADRGLLAGARRATRPPPLPPESAQGSDRQVPRPSTVRWALSVQRETYRQHSAQPGAAPGGTPALHLVPGDRLD